MENTESLLWRYWKHKNFREPQKEIIQDLEQGHDVLAILPTGAGKSLCYQLPALLKPGVCLVISPLIALMQDQVNSLKNKGIRAIYLRSGKKQDEIIEAFDNLRFGNYKFLYLSPEKLQSIWIQQKIRELPINLIAIDEAHCISQWGHDFRPSYRKLSILSEMFQGVPKIALTATATQKVRDDILQQLGMQDAIEYKSSINRSNLRLEIKNTPNLQESLKYLLRDNSDSCIIYVGTRKDTIFYSGLLNHIGIRSSYYHGGMSPSEKMSALNSWTGEATPVMVATNAFGMGIDKSNVRKVIHCHLPQSPENYLQEIGRAGRDGKMATAILLYNRQMLFRGSEWRHKNTADADYTFFIYQKLCDYYHVPRGEGTEEEFPFSLESFCTTYKLAPSMCLAALGHLENDDVILLNHDARRTSSVQIKTRGKDLYALADERTDTGRVVQFLLRNYGGILEQRTPVYEDVIAKGLNLSREIVIRSLEELSDRNLLLYSGLNENGVLQFLIPREENFVRSQIKFTVATRNRNKKELSEAMEDIILNHDKCRVLKLAEYFGEDQKEACGICDLCLSDKKHQKSYETLQKEIFSLLSNHGPCSINLICEELDQKKERVVKTLEIMMEKDLLSLNLQNKIALKS